MNVIHLFSDSKLELPLDGRSAPVSNSVPIPLVETVKLKQHTNQVPGPNDLVVMIAEETTLHNDTRFWCELMGNVGNIVRFVGGMLDAYTIGVEKRQADASQQVRPGRLPVGRPQPSTAIAKSKIIDLSGTVKKIQANVRRRKTQLELPTQAESKSGGPPGPKIKPNQQIPRNSGDLDYPDPEPGPQDRARRGAAEPMTTEEQVQLQRSLSGVRKIWKWGSVGFTFASFGISIYVTVAKHSLPEDGNGPERTCRYVNMAFQATGAMSILLGSCRDVDLLCQSGGIALQIGSIIEWVGTIIQRTSDRTARLARIAALTSLNIKSEPVSDLFKRWEYPDMVGCGFGFAASVMALSTACKPYAMICTGIDGGAAAISAVGGFCNRNKTVREVEAELKAIQAEDDAEAAKKAV